VSPQSASRWLLGALVASLALNIAVGAFLLPRAWLPRPGGEPVGQAAPHARHWERLIERLPGEAGGLVRQEMLHSREAIDRARDAMGRAREAARAALLANPYDAAAHAAALAELRRRGDAAQALLHASVVATAGKLDHAGRQQLADWQRRRHGPPERDKPR